MYSLACAHDAPVFACSGPEIARYLLQAAAAHGSLTCEALLFIQNSLRIFYVCVRGFFCLLLLFRYVVSGGGKEPSFNIFLGGATGAQGREAGEGMLLFVIFFVLVITGWAGERKKSIISSASFLHSVDTTSVAFEWIESCSQILQLGFFPFFLFLFPCGSYHVLSILQMTSSLTEAQNSLIKS